MTTFYVPPDGAEVGAVTSGGRSTRATARSGQWSRGFAWLLTLIVGGWLPMAEAAVTYRGQSNTDSGTTAVTSLTITRPANTAVGEVLIAVIGGNRQGATAAAIPAPSGWTLINNTVNGSLTVSAYYRVATASDPASWTWTTTAAQPMYGTVMRYSGVNTTTPLDVAAAATNLASTAAPAAPSVTTVTAGAKVIRAFTANNATATASPGTQLVLINRTPANPYSHGVSESIKLTAGATGTASFTLSTAAGAARTLTFALRPAALVAGELSGVVYRDYNGSGALNGFEPGTAGVNVTATDASGNTVTTTTAADGSYTVDSTNGAPAALSGSVRLEFTRPANGSLDFLYPGAAGGTTVQFANITSGASGVNAGFNNPAEYRQADPWVVMPIYRNGSSTGSASNAIRAHVYSANSKAPTLVALASQGQVGSTWGIAFQSEKKRLFAASVLRRHAGLSRGPGHVHVINNTGTAWSFAGSFNLQGVTPANGGAAIDLGSVCRRDTISGGGTTCGTAQNNALGAEGSPNIDLDAFDKVGKVSFGDADLQEDGNTLWLVNLNQRALISVGVSGSFTDGQVPGTVRQYPIASLPGLPTCNNGIFRPWGLKFHDGYGYLGGVCSEEASTSTTASAELKAYVLRFNPANVSAGFTTMLNFPLNYSRERIWHPWTNVWRGGGYWATPILSDIEFSEDGSMRLGFMDRYGMQSGINNYTAVSGSTTLAEVRSAGENLEACLISGSFVLEGGSGCPGKSWIANSGPNTSTYRYQQRAGDGWNFAAGGALGWLPGSGELITNMWDPYPNGYNPGSDSSVYWTNGTGRYSAASGAHVAGATVVGSSNAVNGFGKSNGIGDLEFLLDAAPIEIGNRVWNDVNGNGIQDPGEAPLVGVTVTLKNAAGTVIGTAVTDANGNYLFSNGTGTSTASAKYGLTGITANTNGYQLVIATTDSALGGRIATIPNNDATTNGDLRDSDGIVSGSSVIATVNTGPTGANDHTNDFGFTTVGYSLGNRVWLDNGAGGGTSNDGVQNGSEAGLAGVVVKLYTADGSGNPTGSVLATKITDANGWYRFDGLAAGTYVPVVDVAGSAILTGLISSTGVSSDTSLSGDLQDHGDDTPLAADSLLPGGIVGTAITLGAGLQPTGEAVTASGAGAHGLGDAYDNLTDDFGFVSASNFVALGNRVWLDNGAGGGTANDGRQNGSEPGVSGVTVNLYTGTGTLVDTTTTDSLGYYYFDLLSPGQYYVQIPASEFADGKPLDTLHSSTGADSTTTTDLNDNGIDAVDPSATGVRSNTFTLVAGTMPTGEDQTGYPGSLPDANVNGTDDFGFVTTYSLGNRVFLDDGTGGGGASNGVQDGAEAGIPGVIVKVYAAVGGQPTGTALGSMTTDAGGYYRFDGLPAGDYVVVVDKLGSGVLNHFGSSPSASSDFTVTGDRSDHGIDTPLAAGSVLPGGIASGVVTLGPSNPTGEPDVAGTGAGAHAAEGDLHDNLVVDFGFYALIVPELKIEKTVSNSQPPLGKAFTYTLQVTNKAGGAATTDPVQVVDTPPTGVTITAVDAPAGWTCVTDTQAATLNLPLIGNGTRKLTCDRTGAMATGASETLKLTAKATQSAVAPATGLVNHASVTGDGDTPDPNKPDGSYESNHDKAPVNPTSPVIGLLKKVALTDETGTTDGQAQAGEKLTYTFTITNRGNVNLTPVGLADPQLDTGTLSCADDTSLGNSFSLSGPTSLLRPGESVICTGKHTLTAAEAAAGHVANTANTTGKAPDGTPVQATSTGVWDNTPPDGETLQGRVSLVKTAVHNDGSNGQPVNGEFDAGETVTYGFIVRNMGDQALTDIAVTDPLLASVGSNIACGASSLAVGASTTCAVSPAYVLTASDVSAGKVINTAQVDAKDPANHPVTDTDTHVLNSGEPVALELEKTAVLVPGLKVGDTITYTLLATNTGATAINSVTINDDLGVITSCSPAQGSNLGVGQQMACTATHKIRTGETRPVSNLGRASGTAEGRNAPTEATAHHLVPYVGDSPVPVYSVGNQIFWDVNNDGQMNGGEIGIKGVEVELQQWNGLSWLPAKYADDTVIPNQVTDTNGLYLFQTVPQNQSGQPYRVVVVPANFGSSSSGSGPLYSALSSGVDSTDFTDAGNSKDHGTGTQPQSYGIVSPGFDLNELPDGVYELLNVDFGFVKKSTSTSPDLSFVSAVSSPTVAPGGSVTVTLSASNLLDSGNLTKAPVMTETLPAGLTVANELGANFNSTDGKWKCSVNAARTQVSCAYIGGGLPLPGGASLGQAQFPVSVAAGVTPGASLTATGSVSKLVGEPNLTNNVHSVSVTVTP